MQLVVVPKMPAEGFAEWDDEVKDKKVIYLEELITNGHVFKKSDWHGGDDSEELYVYKTKPPVVVHKKHVVSRKVVSAEEIKEQVVTPRKGLDRAKCIGGRKKIGLETKRTSQKIKEERELNRKQQTIHKFMKTEAPNDYAGLKEWMEKKLEVIVGGYKRENQILSDRISRNEKKIQSLRSKRRGQMSRRRCMTFRKGKSNKREKESKAEASAGTDLERDVGDDQVVRNGAPADWECYGLTKQIVEDINKLSREVLIE